MRSALSPLAKPLPKDTRSVAKRRADALVELARRVLTAGALPVEGGVRPQVGLTVDVAELRRKLVWWSGLGWHGVDPDRAGFVATPRSSPS